MKIGGFTLRHIHGFKDRDVDLQKINVLYSKENETGKTTLMRAILYTLGFSIPNTELINFNDFEFAVEVIINKIKFNIIRKRQLLTINDNEYDLPVDLTSAHFFLFGTTNNEIVSNILGTIYFDQEKGWTLLNRGKIIGDNRFKIEGFFRGLKGDESDNSYRLVVKINALEKKIAQYKLMSSVSEYQESVNRDVEKKFDYKTYEQKLDEEMLAKKIRLQKVDDEINSITELMKKNKNFSDFLSAKKIYVTNPIDGSPIRVTRENLFEYIDTEEINSARKGKLIAERGRLKNEILEREQAQEKEEILFDLSNTDEELTQRFRSIQNFSSMQVKIMLDKFQKERRELKEELQNKTKLNNSWIIDAYAIIRNYAKELKIPLDYKIDVFTSNLKAKSGAILHKMVFIYKLAYIKLLSKKLGYPLPIFLDSPSGREVEKSTIDEMLRIIKRDFSDHQIIIASIYNYLDIFPKAKTITMNRTLFDNDTLFDSDNEIVEP
jgi:hypothetical protein